jgi:hypothetical protein
LKEKKRPLLEPKEADFIKAFYWEMFLCDDKFILPASFFQTSPYIHPSGQSYALIRVTSAKGDNAGI